MHTTFDKLEWPRGYIGSLHQYEPDVFGAILVGRFHGWQATDSGASCELAAANRGQ